MDASSVTWRDLELGDTVQIGDALMTLVKQEGMQWTWLLLEMGMVFNVDYTLVRTSEAVDCTDPTQGSASKLFSRLRSNNEAT